MAIQGNGRYLMLDASKFSSLRLITYAGHLSIAQQGFKVDFFLKKN